MDSVAEALRYFQVLLVNTHLFADKQEKAEMLASRLYHDLWTDEHRSVGIVCSNPVQCYERTSNGIFGFDKVIKKHESRLTFMSEEALLNEFFSDKAISKYSAIILTVHQIDWRLNILILLLQALIGRRKDFRLAIISDTLAIDFDMIIGYFGGRKVAEGINESGEDIACQVFFSPASPNDIVNASVELVKVISKEGKEGNIMIFLSNSNQVDRAMQLLDDIDGVVPICMNDKSENYIFNARKVFLTANKIESNLQSVEHIIDCGYSAEWAYDIDGHVYISKSVRLSKSLADRRAVMGSKCYRLYSTEEFELFDDYEEANLQCPIPPILCLLQLGYTHFAQESLIISIRDEEAAYAATKMTAMDAIDDYGVLTIIGHQLARLCLVMKPEYARALIAAIDLNCSLAVLKIISVLQLCTSITFPSITKKAKLEMAVMEGDHIVMLNIVNAYLKSNRSQKWASQHSCIHSALEKAISYLNEARDYCERLFKIQLVDSKDHVAVRKALAKGIFYNAAIGQPDGSYKSCKNGKQLWIHPDSFMFHAPIHACIVYDECSETTKSFIKYISPVEMAWLAGKDNTDYWFIKKSRR